MTGAATVIDDATAACTILSVKERVFAVNSQFHVRRQRLVYRPGPRGMDALADDETLGGAGVAQGGAAELDVLLEDLTEAEAAELGSILLKAARNGRASDILELLDEGAHVEFKEGNVCTALGFAAASGHVDCVRLLLHAGAD